MYTTSPPVLQRSSPPPSIPHPDARRASNHAYTRARMPINGLCFSTRDPIHQSVIGQRVPIECLSTESIYTPERQGIALLSRGTR